jgi:biopolymer transport protein ExbD
LLDEKKEQDKLEFGQKLKKKKKYQKEMRKMVKEDKKVNYKQSNK